MGFPAQPQRPVTESDKWTALSQISNNRADTARQQGYGYQATFYEQEAKRSQDYASRMHGLPGGAVSWGIAPQIANGANDFKGFVDREPELANLFDQNFMNWVNQASGGIGRGSYSVLSTPSGGGIDRGQGEKFEDGTSISNAPQYVKHGSPFAVYNGGDFSTQSGALGPYAGKDLNEAQRRDVTYGRDGRPTGWAVSTKPGGFDPFTSTGFQSHWYPNFPGQFSPEPANTSTGGNSAINLFLPVPGETSQEYAYRKTQLQNRGYRVPGY